MTDRAKLDHLINLSAIGRDDALEDEFRLLKAYFGAIEDEKRRNDPRVMAEEILAELSAAVRTSLPDWFPAEHLTVTLEEDTVPAGDAFGWHVRVQEWSRYGGFRAANETFQPDSNATATRIVTPDYHSGFAYAVTLVRRWRSNGPDGEAFRAKVRDQVACSAEQVAKYVRAAR